VLKRRLHPILTQLGTPLGGTLAHALRHGRVTLRRKRGIPHHLEQLWIGHSTLDMTDPYSHTDQELEYRRGYAVQAGMKLVQ
jgi:hypothetical protein